MTTRHLLFLVALLSAAIPAPSSPLRAESDDGWIGTPQAAVSGGRPQVVEFEFHSALRGILQEFVLSFPADVTAQWDSVEVDVVGRGFAPLCALQQQSAGRHGTAFSRESVGKGTVSHEDGHTLIRLEDIDLRPDNGIDLCIRLPQFQVRKAGSITVCAAWHMGGVTLPDAHRGEAYREVFPSSSSLQLTMPVHRRHAHQASATSRPTLDVSAIGCRGDGVTDNTDLLNTAIAQLSEQGGGILSFPAGTWMMRTVHLRSGVWLHVSRDAVLAALPGMDDPEETWFADISTNAGNHSLDATPYDVFGNYITKQDAGHSFFHNAMFVAERAHDIRIFGQGRITGNGVLGTGNDVLSNPSGYRADKMFAFKLCSDVEIGGEGCPADMWYDDATDGPCYLTSDGGHDTSACARMLHIDRGGHFVLLATGTDDIRVHDLWAGRDAQDNVRDILDFMECRHVRVNNLYSRVSGDDIVKLGSDCALGFTRPSFDIEIRNIVGDTHCNLFQIGSETADDIRNVYVDNLYVLAADKAGVSISANDGGTVSNIWLNSGRTGTLHHRSVMHRTRAPFFVSISNRGRVIGSQAEPYTYNEEGTERHELLVTNVSIGSIEHIYLQHIDCDEVYAGSSYHSSRWKPYDGTQPESTSTFAGYSLPDSIQGGRSWNLPDGRATGYIKDVVLRDVDITAKGGHPATDRDRHCPEIGIGHFNIRDFGVQPACGLWARHVDGFHPYDVRVHTEQPDARDAIVLEDVLPGRWDKERYPNAEPLRTDLLSEFSWKPGEPNQPVGTARGLFPGRVAMARLPETCRWQGRWDIDDDQWFLDSNTDTEGCSQMLDATLCSVTGAPSAAEAWDRLFRFYNREQRGREQGWQPGERVAIKININNSKARREHSNMSDLTPQLLLAMVRTLVREGGVQASDIMVYDARRPIPAEMLTMLWDEFPDVLFVQDDQGVRDWQPVNPKTGDHSLLQKPQWTQRLEFSSGSFNGARKVPQQVVDATYLINFAMLKLHSYPFNYMEGGDEGQTAVTMNAKNHAGSIQAPWEMHRWLNTQQDGTPHAYSPLVDLNASPLLGAKTILYVLDGLYCGRKHASYPIHFPNAPFCNQAEPYENSQWPACVLMSMDQVALESVGLDIVYAQSLNNYERGFYSVPRIMVRNNADDYLLEMADPLHAPSGIRYRQDGKPVESLGVFEHWDSPATMRYSRNLDPINGKGIEFIYIPLGAAKEQ